MSYQYHYIAQMPVDVWLLFILSNIFSGDRIWHLCTGRNVTVRFISNRVRLFWLTGLLSHCLLLDAQSKHLKTKLLPYTKLFITTNLWKCLSLHFFLLFLWSTMVNNLYQGLNRRLHGLKPNRHFQGECVCSLYILKNICKYTVLFHYCCR